MLLLKGGMDLSLSWPDVIIIMKEPVYYLEVTAENCIVNARINGFPFYELNAKYKTYFACPMNIGLVEGTNALEVDILPAIGELAEGNDVPEPEAKIEVKLYENKTVSGPELGEVLRAQTVKSFLTAEVPFENESDIDFSAFFDSLEPIEDENELREYVKKFVSKAWASDVGFFQQAFDFKFKQYAEAYYERPEDYKRMGMGFLTDFVLAQLPDDYAERSALTVFRPFNDRKIWHAMLPDGEEVLYTKPDADDNVSFVRIYLGKIGGQITVIR